MAQEKPDLVVLDLSLDDSLMLVHALHAQAIPVAVCSSHEEPEYARKALASGARA